MYANIGSPVVKSAGNSQIKNGPGILIGVLCSSSTTGTLSLNNGTSGSDPLIVSAFTLVAGTFTPIPMAFSNGLFATIGGTATVTFLVA